MYGHVLVLPSQRLVRTAAEDDIVICQNVPMDVRLLPSQHLVHTAAEDDFVIC